jgi:hypothetical protein
MGGKFGFYRILFMGFQGYLDQGYHRRFYFSRAGAFILARQQILHVSTIFAILFMGFYYFRDCSPLLVATCRAIGNDTPTDVQDGSRERTEAHDASLCERGAITLWPKTQRSAPSPKTQVRAYSCAQGRIRGI